MPQKNQTKIKQQKTESRSWCIGDPHTHKVPGLAITPLLLLFSLTTNHREKQLNDVIFCFIEREMGVDISYLGKLIPYH